jgi:hypothetical protein
MSMATDDPRTMPDSDAGLRLLLAETDREDPILAAPPREDAGARAEELDEQILAGLVAP